MTNTQIIEEAKAKLIADGKIQPDEELHTYKMWKKKGYQVYRGEKALVQLNIWQAYSKKHEDEDEEDEKRKQDQKMRIRRASFFGTHQVFELEAEA